MKTLFYPTVFFLLALAVISCTETDVTLEPAEISAKQYPSEITLENWEAFIDAPQELIDEIIGINSNGMVQSAVTSSPLISGKNALQKSGPTYFGWVRARTNNGFVSMPKTVIRGYHQEKYPKAESFFFSNTYNELPSGDNWHNNARPRRFFWPVCYYKNIKGSYSASDWRAGLDVGDVLAVKRHISGHQPFSILESVAADVNHDAKVTKEDLYLIYNVLQGKKYEFPKMLDYSSGKYYIKNQPYIYLNETLYSVAQNVKDLYIYKKKNIYYSNAFLEPIDVNHLAIKRGDVNGSLNIKQVY